MLSFSAGWEWDGTPYHSQPKGCLYHSQPSWEWLGYPNHSQPNIPWGASSPPDPLDLCTKQWKTNKEKRRHINGGALRAPPHTWKRRFAPLPCMWFHLCLLSLLCPFSLCFSLFCVRCQGPLPQWDLRGLGPWRQSARSRGSGGLEAPQGILILQAMGLRGGWRKRRVLNPSQVLDLFFLWRSPYS